MGGDIVPPTGRQAGGPVIDFSGLYRAHAQDVHRFALFLSGDRELAEDLVSETFIRLWNARARVELATVRAYLFAIARNLYLQQLRGRRPRAPLDDELADARPGPAARAQARDELATTLAALQTLPEVDRAALLMRAGDELSYEEIAAALGLTPTAARVKVHRARLKLSQARDAAATPPTAMEIRR
jgi:RNA polymerase sigma-70 factor (ECF subfamily)